MSQTLLRIALALFGVAPITEAAAICLPGPHTIYVGKNIGTETGCNFSDIQSAVDAAVCPNTTITMSTYNSMTYTGVHVAVSDKSLTFEGTGDACNTQVVCPPSGCSGVPVQIPLVGDFADPVFSITDGGNVRFFNLDISNGNGVNAAVKGGGIGVTGSNVTVALTNVSVHHNVGANGGGIAFDGGGSLTLSGVTIYDNQGGNGGGVYVLGEPTTPVEFDILDNPQIQTGIEANLATNGGGLFVDGNVHLQAVSSTLNSIAIVSNSATNSGGGLAFSGTGFADVALSYDPSHPPHTDSGGIWGNSALYGGGISVAPNANGNAVLRLFAMAGGPTIIGQNGGLPGQLGGGIQVDLSSSDNHATACIWDAGIFANTLHEAGRGAALAVRNGGHLFFNPQNNAECDYAALTPLGATHCSNGPNNHCNEISYNGLDDAAVGGVHSIVWYDDNTQVGVQRVNIHDHEQLQFVVEGGAAVASFSSCVVALNVSTGDIVSVNGGSHSFDGCTFTQNSPYGQFILVLGGATLSMSRSILAESGPVLEFAKDEGSTINVNYLLDSRATQFLGNPTILQNTDPRFSDSRWHLKSTSIAIDFAPTGSESDSVDLDGNPREVDMPVPNYFGARDLGAYEYQLPDEIFRNGFDT